EEDRADQNGDGGKNAKHDQVAGHSISPCPPQS
ncbi:MAG: hypothetical protein ACI8P0_005438, partial [Planctomycetaceae bacterium]